MNDDPTAILLARDWAPGEMPTVALDVTDWAAVCAVLLAHREPLLTDLAYRILEQVTA